MDINLCMTIKHHTIALCKPCLINSTVADTRSKAKSMLENIDDVRELIMQDRSRTV